MNEKRADISQAVLCCGSECVSAISSSGPPLSRASALSNYFIWMWVVLKHDGKGLPANTLQCLHRPHCRQSYHNTCFRRGTDLVYGPPGLYGNSSYRSSWMSTVWSSDTGTPAHNSTADDLSLTQKIVLGAKSKRPLLEVCLFQREVRVPVRSGPVLLVHFGLIV